MRTYLWKALIIFHLLSSSGPGQSSHLSLTRMRVKLVLIDLKKEILIDVSRSGGHVLIQCSLGVEKGKPEQGCPTQGLLDFQIQIKGSWG